MSESLTQKMNNMLSFFKDSDPNAAVIVHEVSKSFGNEMVLKKVSLRLEKGRIHGIVGRNGSGKTVLMKCICGFLQPTMGAVKVFGKMIGSDCDFAPDTGMLIETPGFLSHETGMNNLQWLAKLGKGASKERISDLIRMAVFPGDAPAPGYRSSPAGRSFSLDPGRTHERLGQNRR